MNDWAEFRHFRYLLTILEKQGFRAAAEELHTSQPNLTVQARQFQENAHVHLFRRSKNGRIRPTETGIAFVGLARLLLELRDETLDALNSIERGDVPSICFGCTPLVDQELFRALCTMHKTLLPSALIRPTHGDVTQLVEEILSGSVDLALVTLPVSHPDLHIEEIRRDRLVVCLREDNKLAQKPALLATNLQGNLTILYHPQRHPAAHAQLIELLNGFGRFPHMTNGNDRPTRKDPRCPSTAKITDPARTATCGLSRFALWTSGQRTECSPHIDGLVEIRRFLSITVCRTS